MIVTCDQFYGFTNGRRLQGAMSIDSYTGFVELSIINMTYKPCAILEETLLTLITKEYQSGCFRLIALYAIYYTGGDSIYPSMPHIFLSNTKK